ncbi:MAG: hypothetical protein MJ237_09225 [bacterium]|nr:hypothetical protein [bacterium]
MWTIKDSGPETIKTIEISAGEGITLDDRLDTFVTKAEFDSKIAAKTSLGDGTGRTICVSELIDSQYRIATLEAENSDLKTRINYLDTMVRELMVKTSPTEPMVKTKGE